MNNGEIAQKIYEKLLEKGAGIRNASIPIIEKVLDESSQFEPLVSPMLAEEIKKARIKENLYWIEWLREVEVACPDREEYESRIEEIEKEE